MLSAKILKSWLHPNENGGMKIVAMIVAAVLLAQGAAAAVEVGDIPPPSIGRDQDGDRVDLAQMSGKVVIVAFWATWCPPCLKELPILEKIRNSVSEDELEVIAINIEDRRTYRTARRKLRDYQMTLVNDHRGIVKRQYGVKSLPHMVIIGKGGVVSSIRLGYSEEQVIEVIDELNDLLFGEDTEAPPGGEGEPF